MPLQTYTENVICPTVEDFANSYPQYAPYAQNEGKRLFELLTSPEAIVKAKLVSEFEFPAVFGVAKSCCKLLKTNTIDNFVKQYIGAVVCSVMELNGYEKTGRKGSVKHEAFTKGEIYTKSE